MLGPMRHLRPPTLLPFLPLLVLSSSAPGCASEPLDAGDAAEGSGQAEQTGSIKSALERDPGGEGGDNPVFDRCLSETTATFAASATSIPLWASTTLSWTLRVPSGCSQVQSYLGQDRVAKSGTKTVVPQANSEFSLRIYIPGYGERTVKTVDVAVVLPPRVDITQNDRVPLFVQALRTPNTHILISDHVELDLTHRKDLFIASNVTIQGGRRRLNPGPRLFTTTRPAVLFGVGETDANVRITGVRIEGPDMGSDTDRHGTRGILINSARNVEIDHCEISGWAGAGIQVRDLANTASSPSPNAADLPWHEVRIHDNFIHHNQALGGDGYGVTSAHGAHPLIERNVFDWNRHAIQGNGEPGTGYTAIYNLVLGGGGRHYQVPVVGTWLHTHQFDMHGTQNCGVLDLFSDSLWNCGPAGHTMIIRHNAFFYDEDDAIKLRGTPAVGMFVGENVFARDAAFWTATSQTESGLVEEPGNQYLYNGMNHLAQCDFDGDGLTDTFLATGESWWYRSGTTGPWEFLAQSKKKRDEVEIGFFDGDNRCDVRVDGALFPGGRPPRPWADIPGDVTPIPIFGN